MRTLLLPATALLVLATFGSAPAAGAETTAPPECIQYMYVADYHWYWLCVNPKDLSCPVYEKEQHGVRVTRTCYPPKLNAAEPSATCVPTSGGLDYPSWLCVDPKDPLCAVYTVTTSDWGVSKRCWGLIEQ